MAARPAKILIVEDEEDLARLLMFRLRRAGFEVDSATDGKSGLEKAFSFQPDVILLDVIMPGMSGWEVCEKLKNHPQTKGIAVLIVTAAPSSEYEQKAKSLGADGMIFKPFNSEELMAFLTKVLKKK